MLDRNLSPATVARRVAALARAVNRARMVGLTRLTLETEPPRAEAFRDVSGPGADGWRKLLERAEAEAADGTPRTARNLAILLFLHDRALRRSEVVRIDYPDDLDPPRPAVAVRGKGKHAKEWLTINPQHPRRPHPPSRPEGGLARPAVHPDGPPRPRPAPATAPPAPPRPRSG